jgi:hypothetical protein
MGRSLRGHVDEALWTSSGPFLVSGARAGFHDRMHICAEPEDVRRHALPDCVLRYMSAGDGSLCCYGFISVPPASEKGTRSILQSTRMSIRLTLLVQINLWTMGFIISPFISPFLFGFAVARTSWRWSYGAGTIYGAVVVVLIALFMEETFVFIARCWPTD